MTAALRDRGGGFFARCEDLTDVALCLAAAIVSRDFAIIKFSESFRVSQTAHLSLS